MRAMSTWRALLFRADFPRKVKKLRELVLFVPFSEQEIVQIFIHRGTQAGRPQSAQHLDDHDSLAGLFSSVRRHLSPGGRFSSLVPRSRLRFGALTAGPSTAAGNTTAGLPLPTSFLFFFAAFAYPLRSSRLRGFWPSLTRKSRGRGYTPPPEFSDFAVLVPDT